MTVLEAYAVLASLYPETASLIARQKLRAVAPRLTDQAAIDGLLAQLDEPARSEIARGLRDFLPGASLSLHLG